MNKYKCPHCKKLFDSIKEPDLEYELCSSCGGIFLDKDELNILATGFSGNIEFCSIDENFVIDKFLPRFCPKCDVQMRKINLLGFSDVIIDYCDSCEGFFLDKYEPEQMNNYLAWIDNDTPQEFREKINGILVRCDIKGGIRMTIEPMLPGIEKIQEENFLLISAYFNKPIDFEFNISQETLSFKILKLFTRKLKSDVPTGFNHFDSVFKISCQNPILIRRFLLNAPRDLLLNFVNSSLTAYGIKGKITIDNKKITYKEGPYIDIPKFQNNEFFKRIMDKLVEIILEFEKNNQSSR